MYLQYMNFRPIEMSLSIEEIENYSFVLSGTRYLSFTLLPKTLLNEITFSVKCKTKAINYIFCWQKLELYVSTF